MPQRYVTYSLFSVNKTTLLKCDYKPTSQPSGVQSAIKPGTSDNLPTLAATSVDFYPTINSTLNTTNPGPVQWSQTRPTLTGGIVGGRMSGECHSGAL